MARNRPICDARADARVRRAAGRAAAGWSSSTTCGSRRTGRPCTPPTRRRTRGTSGASGSGQAGRGRRRGHPQGPRAVLPRAGHRPAGERPARAKAVVADVLDLQHRLPLTWARLEALAADAFVARRVAAKSRRAALAAVGAGRRGGGAVIGTALRGPGAGDRGGRDHRGRSGRPRREGRGRAPPPVRGLSRTDEHGLRTVIARVEAGDAVWVDAMVERVADILATRAELRPRPRATTSPATSSAPWRSAGWPVPPSSSSCCSRPPSRPSSPPTSRRTTRGGLDTDPGAGAVDPCGAVHGDHRRGRWTCSAPRT